LKERGIKIAVWGANGRAEQMIRYTNDEWESFREAGLKEILIGAESGDQEMLNLINKQSPVEATLECEVLAKKHGVNVINSFMTSFPPQTDKPEQIKLILKRELDQTVNFIRKIFKINPIANILLFFYTPYPGTPLYELAVRRGFKEPKNLKEWATVDLAHRVTPWTTSAHINKVLLLSKLFILKKITSQEYVESKKNRKYYLIKFLGWHRLMGFWIDFRLKYKFYFLPWERIIFVLNKIIK
jgi:radical SAM superfamily enzyme YgiQ (UPF0313 family)